MTGSGWPWSDRRRDPRGSGGPVTCEQFRDVAEDLALGAIDDPERAELFAHAAGCPACQARLDELALLTDRLLLAAPELEGRLPRGRRMCQVDRHGRPLPA